MQLMSNEKKNLGPQPDSVKIDDDWVDAITDAMKKKRPKDGWPSDK